jgi:hypothetical protein
LRGSEFQDVGSEFWSLFEKEIRQKRGALNNADLREFLHPIANDTSNHEMTRSTVLQIALDYLYAGRFEEAKATMSTMWPANSREGTWIEMLSGYCSGLRAQLGLKSGPPCRNEKTNSAF